MLLGAIEEEWELVEDVAAQDNFTAGFVACDLCARKAQILNLQFNQEEHNWVGIAPWTAKASFAYRMSFNSANQRQGQHCHIRTGVHDGLNRP